jgi:hypothetical protein
LIEDTLDLLSSQKTDQLITSLCWSCGGKDRVFAQEESQMPVLWRGVTAGADFNK